MAAVQPAAVPAWVAGSLPPDFFAAQEVDARGAVVRQRGTGPPEGQWSRPQLGTARSVKSPSEADLGELASLGETLADARRTRMLAYRLQSEATERTAYEQELHEVHRSAKRWAGGSNYTRVGLPRSAARGEEQRGSAGEQPAGRPSAAPPSRSRPKPRRGAAAVPLGFAHADGEPLHHPLASGTTILTDPVQNRPRLLPGKRTTGSEIAPSDPRVFDGSETEEQKRARVLRSSARLWLQPERKPSSSAARCQPAPEAAEQTERRTKAAARDSQLEAARGAAVDKLLRLLGVQEVQLPLDPDSEACIFAQRLEAHIERCYNEGKLSAGRRADKATLFRVLRDYVEGEHVSGIAPEDLRRAFVQLGQVVPSAAFQELVQLCRHIAEPAADHSDEPDMVSPIELEHLADGIRQLAARAEPLTRKVCSFPEEEKAAVAAHLVWRDDDALCVGKTDAASRNRAVRYQSLEACFQFAAVFHVIIGLWQDEPADDTDSHVAAYLDLLCVAVHAADCVIQARLSASWKSDTVLCAKAVMTSALAVDSVASFAVGGAPQARALRPAFLVLVAGCLRREADRALRLLRATSELVVVGLALAVMFAMSFALAEASPDLLVAPGCPEAKTNPVLVVLCGGFAAGTTVLWGLLTASIIAHGERLKSAADAREVERRRIGASPLARSDVAKSLKDSKRRACSGTWRIRCAAA